ncbi:MAG: hypothetical protein R3C52_16025, partial [Hyphomonadaceae bacterium]
MTDDYDRRSSARLRARLEAARTAGAWMPWLGLLTALLLWGGAGLWLYANFGLETLLSQPLPAIIGAVTAILAPGVALIAAGIMARESRRSSEANALVMSAARLLLEPAEHVRGEITTIATDVAD